MPDNTNLPTKSEPEPYPRPTLVYGWPGGSEGLVFAPLEEVRRWAALRTATGFPMTWGEFRERHGEDAYEEYVAPIRENAPYRSFEELLYDGGGGWLDADPPFDWRAWRKDYWERALPKLRAGGGRIIQGENHLRYWYEVTHHEELADVELRDWFDWYGARSPGAVRPATFEAFRAQAAAVMTQQMAELEAAYGVETRREYQELPVGDQGRAPEDGDIAEFMDSEGNTDNTPAIITYWPAQRMLGWFPPDLARRFGGEVDTVLDGEHLELDSSRTEEIVAALEALGYECVEDDRLMNVACGYPVLRSRTRAAAPIAQSGPNTPAPPLRPQPPPRPEPLRHLSSVDEVTRDGVVGEQANEAPAPVATGVNDALAWVVPRLRELVRSRSVKLDALLNGSCEAVSWQDGVLTLGFYEDKFHKKSVEDAPNRRVYEELAAQILGAPVAIRCIAARPSRTKLGSSLGKEATDTN